MLDAEEGEEGVEDPTATQGYGREQTNTQAVLGPFMQDVHRSSVS